MSETQAYMALFKYFLPAVGKNKLLPDPHVSINQKRWVNYHIILKVGVAPDFGIAKV